MNLVIREAGPADAAALLNLLRDLSAEAESNLALMPGEVSLTIPEEEQILARYAEEPNSLFLVAEVDREIVGVLTCKGSQRQATRDAVGTTRQSENLPSLRLGDCG